MALTLPRVLRQPLQILKALLFNPKYFWHLASLVIIGDVLLTGLIINYVPCQFQYIMLAQSYALTLSAFRYGN